MDKPLEFEILNCDKVIFKVRYDYATKKLDITSFGDFFLDKGLLSGVETIDDLCDWLETRCFLRSREDVGFHLEALGLTEYSPYNIARKTNGALFEDTYWIRWHEQPYLTWSDVNPRSPDCKPFGAR